MLKAHSVATSEMPLTARAFWGKYPESEREMTDEEAQKVFSKAPDAVKSK